ncbi:hypothetical protein IFR04_002437 [Cadophora malorum]|uniref:Uncharacterized protein n=1 Tax=Cadophora malorum TaxID=108018 RepID=A0A8H7WGM3_9HELO|nr:hypothetical protein IFR04_002437 [Cadophora malorum]
MATTLPAPSLSEGRAQTKGGSPFPLKEPITISSHVVAPIEKAMSMTKKELLVVSPYLEESHLLDLSTLDTPNQLLANALVDLKFIRDDHRTAPYLDSLNWPEIINSVRKLAETSDFKWKTTDFYIVVFRSRIPPTTVYADLGVLDKAAHAEATESGGFLKYLFSCPDAEGRNLATCVWRSKHDAAIGSVGPHHRKAAQATRLLYAEWAIERLRLVIHDEFKSWDIVQWSA